MRSGWQYRGVFRVRGSPSALQDVYADFAIVSRHENPPSLDLRQLLIPGGTCYTERLWGTYLPAVIDYSGYIPGTTGAIFGPQGGVRTSASDLSKFMRDHMHDGEYGLLSGMYFCKEEG